MNNRKKIFLDKLDKYLKGEELLPKNIHKNVIFFDKENYSLLSVKYIVLSYRFIFHIYNLFFFVFTQLFKRQPILLTKIYKALYLAPHYGAIILDLKKIAWIDLVVEQLQLNKKDNILLLHGFCINYKTRTIGYNNQRSLIDTAFFFLISSYLVCLFFVYIFLFLYSIQSLSYKFILGIVFGIILYVSIKFYIITYKAIIFDANNIIKRRNYFDINVT
ncbi:MULTISPECIES: hypothetical protein [Gilliamella]|uniref:Uncharacterized protein n=1 Tax=Gilliamella apicola TaxID=1196095 RepID=A0A556SC25_9GAMM|nr:MULTISPECIES: hypothetical protein [Gilliamella]MBI0095232.1 hypothetical protein [Gilliamella sp. W8136]TSJ98699.1 hypothetical protein FPQ15_07525 [Gilliamella apicola]